MLMQTMRGNILKDLELANKVIITRKTIHEINKKKTALKHNNNNINQIHFGSSASARIVMY